MICAGLQPVCICLCVCVNLAVEVTWEDQQLGLNGSLSNGGSQPHPSLADTGWSVWVWIPGFPDRDSSMS